MTPTRVAIQKLVALKRQRAEQELARVTSAIRAERAELERLQQSLEALDTSGAGFAEIALSARFGRSSFLLEEISKARGRIAQKEQALEAAREALRRAIHSENEIG